MVVHPTDQWLEKAYHSPEQMFKKLTRYFTHSTPEEIASLLTYHGMYKKPSLKKEDLLRQLRERKVWEIIKKEEQLLKQKWNGRNVSIFIFPSNTNDRKISQHYNGKSGLAFIDKLFLFISQENSEQELKALFTHEYNHCCRLLHAPKSERKYHLLDVVILEGLAENAVQERFGPDYLAPYTGYYSKQELESIWEKIIQPNKELPKTSSKANAILYGKNLYPKMAGYAVGYYLVNRYVQENGVNSLDLLTLPAEKIAQLNT
ncbi:DUF2268 domain-containing protein [Ornithinibacillus contaminans]|uniref:DUF2268 domain-containing protein n=1 Tax=Ornithinibacillus contaminans TaxID=694055 RepID=UPI00064D88B2|nr:DUF2268 domain-containing protein [Ornithinibacillus contaminans]